MTTNRSKRRASTTTGFARTFGPLAGVIAVAVFAAGNVHCGTGDDSVAPNNGVPTPDASTVDASLDGASMSKSDASRDAATSDGSVAPTGPCSGLPGTVVYVESGDTQENLLKNLGRQLRDQANITLAFNLTGSCTLTNDIYTGAKMVPNGTLKYIPSTAENPSWDPSQAEATCTTDASGAPIDVAISALFVESCGLGGPPAGSGLALIQGPIQAYTFVVPTASDQNAIWAEEAYYAFGFGNSNPLAPTYNPWNSESFMFIRPTTKSTLVATAKNIDVPPTKWKGVQESASGDVVNAVVHSATPEATIGILGAEVYDADRSMGLKTLAFQAFGQHGAYYPDSTASAFDKQNLRDGHYTLWSPTVYIAHVGDSGTTPTNPAVAYLTDLVLGNPTTNPLDGGPAIDGLADVVKVGLIPQCAMKVTRSTDGGDLSSFAPPASCGCYYMSKIPGATGTPAGCTPCASTSDCADAGGTCQYGFCEPSAAEATNPGDAGNGCFSGTPTTNADIVNACTSAPAVFKNVVLPAEDGGLEPLP
jgi:hypothetical protein